MPKVYVSLCTKLDGLNVVKINFTIGDSDYNIVCEKSSYEGSFYGNKLDGLETLQLIKFLQKAFDDDNLTVNVNEVKNE